MFKKSTVRITGPDPGGYPTCPPARSPSATNALNLQREAKFSKTRKSEKKTIVFAADRCSVAKIQVPVSLRKSIVFVADRCSVAENGAKRPQT